MAQFLASVEPGDERAVVEAVENHCRVWGEDHRPFITFLPDDEIVGNVMIVCTGYNIVLADGSVGLTDGRDVEIEFDDDGGTLKVVDGRPT